MNLARGKGEGTNYGVRKKKEKGGARPLSTPGRGDPLDAAHLTGGRGSADNPIPRQSQRERNTRSRSTAREEIKEKEDGGGRVGGEGKNASG